MFGCGLPVAAKSCPALHELVINGINGMIFDTPEELANQVLFLRSFNYLRFINF
jgi:beta-1,4-mannosyltransferase